MQVETAVVAHTGNGATVATLAAQGKVHILNVREQGRWHIQVTHIGERLRAETVSVQEVNHIDDGVLEDKRQQAHHQHFFQLHVGGNLGFQVLLFKVMGLLGLDGLNHLAKSKIAVLHIHSQVYIGGEVAHRTAVVKRPQIHWNGHLKHRAFLAAGIQPVLLLQGIKHGRCKKFGHRAVVLPANLLDFIGR